MVDPYLSRGPLGESDLRFTQHWNTVLSLKNLLFALTGNGIRQWAYGFPLSKILGAVAHDL
jgi:hypothetical protein